MQILGNKISEFEICVFKNWVLFEFFFLQFGISGLYRLDKNKQIKE